MALAQRNGSSQRSGWWLVIGLTLTWVGLTGCEVDNWLDPSKPIRAEHTPVTMPILERLDVIERADTPIVGLSEPTSRDLIPEVAEYVLGPGDQVVVTVFELIQPNAESQLVRRIDELGFIRLPVVGQIKAAGLTTKKLEQQIINILHPNILRDPTVTVLVNEARQKTFNVIGAAGGVGTYNLLKSNFRLIDAIALSRGFPGDTEKIYVIRHVPLNDIVEKGYAYEQEVKPGEIAPPLIPEGTGAPGTDAGGDIGSEIEDIIEGLEGNAEAPVDGAGATDAGEPAASPTLEEALEPTKTGSGRWVNINGKWVQVTSTTPTPDDATTAQPSLDEDGLPPAEQLVTQRIIEIDAKALMEGDAKWNIVIRPGDIIRIPSPTTGNVFIGGEIARPGTYALPGENRLTLKQLIFSAGGFGPLAIPERVDLVRRIDKNTEATIRLNGRAIFEGVQPDIYMKPDDLVNIGTNPAATFLAVIRNGFRMSYGFGFLLDRNFGPDVFGPVNNNNN